MKRVTLTDIINISEGAVIDLHHVIYPEDCYVSEDVILGWAHDAQVNEAVDDHVKEHGPFTSDPAGDRAYEMVCAAHPRPTNVEEAKALLSDIGTHTFARM